MDPAKRLKQINIYDFTIVSLAVIAIIGVASNPNALLQVLATPVVAAGLDYAIDKFIHKKRIALKSALISGLLVSLIISPGSAMMSVVAVIIAIISKHLLMHSKRSVFNPTALGVVISIIIFSSLDSWWAATISLSQPMTLVIILLAFVTSWKLGKLPLTASYLLANLAFALISQGIPGSNLAITVFLTLFSGSFFAGFMLTDPKTSAIHLPAMIVEGVLISTINFAVSYASPGLSMMNDLILVGLLAINLLLPIMNHRLKFGNKPHAQTVTPPSA